MKSNVNFLKSYRFYLNLLMSNTYIEVCQVFIYEPSISINLAIELLSHSDILISKKKTILIAMIKHPLPS